MPDQPYRLTSKPLTSDDPALLLRIEQDGRNSMSGCMAPVDIPALLRQIAGMIEHQLGVANPAAHTPATQTPTPTVTRTQAEIAARVQAADDIFGWAQQVLLPYCDYETVLPLLNDGVTADDWAKETKDPAKIGKEARAYYDFALGKIADHRGISAERSVIKLREYAWLMGHDDVVAAMDAAPYPEYGAPKVAAFAAGLGYDTPAD